MRRKHFLATGTLLLVMVSVAAGVVASRAPSSDDESTYGYLRLFNEVLALVKNSYVEDVPQDDLMKGAYAGLLASLDGESEYMTAAEYQQIKSGAGENDADVGISLTRRDGVLFVAAVLPGTDAQAKGLRIGDQIRRIGERSSRDMTLSEAARALRGPSGSSLVISVTRRDEPRREDVDVARKRLALPGPRLDAPQDGVAVVRIPAFGAGTTKALAGILERLQKEKLKQAVFDLRANAWGDVDEAVRSATLLVGPTTIAKIHDRRGGEKAIAGTGAKGPWAGEALLLTDAGTAHAAEIFVGALVDAGVAKQGGETTLGRGGEQEILPLANGDYISLTVRKYVSPSGKTWHGTGLAPTVSLPSDPSAPFKERADRQLRKAVDWFKESSQGAKAA
ncbi:MAG TPA: S41 family peptidase [Verrucomicrobiae bacterium]|nr:S41 family peptidase [Verrucomicrobiae bacterium]